MQGLKKRHEKAAGFKDREGAPSSDRPLRADLTKNWRDCLHVHGERQVATLSQVHREDGTERVLLKARLVHLNGEPCYILKLRRKNKTFL